MPCLSVVCREGISCLVFLWLSALSANGGKNTTIDGEGSCPETNVQIENLVSKRPTNPPLPMQEKLEKFPTKAANRSPNPSGRNLRALP